MESHARFAIIDDNPNRFRKHLRKLLEKSRDISIVAETEDRPCRIKYWRITGRTYPDGQGEAFHRGLGDT